MFVTNWISTTKIQKISEITNFFRHYFLSRTEVVFATKRTTVECHKRGDALAVYREAVAVDANEWGGLHVILL